MTIVFHDPRGATRVPPQPYDCRHPLGGGSVVGLLANGFPDASAFLDAIESALCSALPGVRFLRYAKPGASAPASAELIERIAVECDALVTAYGH